MADKQESKTTPLADAVSQSEEVKAGNEPKKVEITVAAEQKPLAAPATVTRPTDDLSQLTPTIMEALSFDSSQKTQQELQAHNSKLQSLLGKVIELLKEKSGLCSNLEKQNTALMLQTNSLKDVVAITKDLLSIRNMEVEHLHVDIKSMEEKINLERERHNNMLNRMSEAVKLNENLKTEYQSQLGLFTDLRARYEEKVALLEAENKRLAAQLGAGSTSAQPQQNTEPTGEGDVELSLEAIPPP